MNNPLEQQDTALPIGEIKTSVDLINGLATSTADAMEVFDDAMKGLKSLSKVGAVLGVFGAALDIVNTFYDIINKKPSPEEQIMEMITEVGNQITELGYRIDDGFTKAELTTQLAIVQSRYGGKKDSMDTLLREVDDYRKTQSDLMKAKASGASDDKIEELEADILQDEGQLLGWWAADNGKSYHEIVTGLANIITTTHIELLNKNILELLYDIRFGDLKKIMATGAIIYQDIVRMSIAFGVIRGIQKKRNVPNFDYEAAKRDDKIFFQEKLQKVSDEIEIYYKKCKEEAPANIEKYTDEVLKNIPQGSPKGDIVGYGYSKSAILLQKELSAVYSWLEISVIIYDPVTGNNQHQIRSLQSTELKGQLHKFRYHVSGTNYWDVNFLVYWVDRKQPARLASAGPARDLVDWINKQIDDSLKKANYWPIDLNLIFANKHTDPENSDNDRKGFFEYYIQQEYLEGKSIPDDLKGLTWWVLWGGNPRIGSRNYTNRRYIKYGDHVVVPGGAYNLSEWSPETTYLMYVFD